MSSSNRTSEIALTNIAVYNGSLVNFLDIYLICQLHEALAKQVPGDSKSPAIQKLNTKIQHYLNAIALCDEKSTYEEICSSMVQLLIALHSVDEISLRNHCLVLINMVIEQYSEFAIPTTQLENIFDKLKIQMNIPLAVEKLFDEIIVKKQQKEQQKLSDEKDRITTEAKRIADEEEIKNSIAKSAQTISDNKEAVKKQKTEIDKSKNAIDEDERNSSASRKRITDINTRIKKSKDEKALTLYNSQLVAKKPIIACLYSMDVEVKSYQKYLEQQQKPLGEELKKLQDQLADIRKPLTDCEKRLTQLQQEDETLKKEENRLYLASISATKAVVKQYREQTCSEYGTWCRSSNCGCGKSYEETHYEADPDERAAAATDFNHTKVRHIQVQSELKLCQIMLDCEKLKLQLKKDDINAIEKNIRQLQGEIDSNAHDIKTAKIVRSVNIRGVVYCQGDSDLHFSSNSNERLKLATLKQKVLELQVPVAQHDKYIESLQQEYKRLESDKQKSLHQSQHATQPAEKIVGYEETCQEGGSWCRSSNCGCGKAIKERVYIPDPAARAQAKCEAETIQQSMDKVSQFIVEAQKNRQTAHDKLPHHEIAKLNEEITDIESDIALDREAESTALVVKHASTEYKVQEARLRLFRPVESFRPLLSSVAILQHQSDRSKMHMLFPTTLTSHQCIYATVGDYLFFAAKTAANDIEFLVVDANKKLKEPDSIASVYGV